MQSHQIHSPALPARSAAVRRRSVSKECVGDGVRESGPGNVIGGKGGGGGDGGIGGLFGVKSLIMGVGYGAGMEDGLGVYVGCAVYM